MLIAVQINLIWLFFWLKKTFGLYGLYRNIQGQLNIYYSLFKKTSANLNDLLNWASTTSHFPNINDFFTMIETDIYMRV